MNVSADAAGFSKLCLLLLVEFEPAQICGVEDTHDCGDAVVLQPLVVGGVLRI